MYFSKTATIAFLALLSQSVAAAPRVNLEQLDALGPSLITRLTGPPGSCGSIRENCHLRPDPNRAQCAADAWLCCEDAHTTCLGSPDADQAKCDAERSICRRGAGLPDRLPKQVRSSEMDVLESDETCAAVRSTCDSSEDADEIMCAAQAALCCDASDRVCRDLPGANMAACHAEKAACYHDYARLPSPHTSAPAAASITTMGS